MESKLRLHSCNQNAHKHFVIIKRSHALIHCVAMGFLVYYRANSFLSQNPENRATVPLLPWLLVFGSELLLFFIWLLDQAFRWRPVSRSVFPERLPDGDKLPGIDVFICTADPEKEPTLGVMNTVLSAMVLDYPVEKLHVYLSDDGGAAVTLYGMKQTWNFARFWLPFCRRYGIKTICPDAYFSDKEDEHDEDNLFNTTQFLAHRRIIKEKYEKLKDSIMRARENGGLGHLSSRNSRDHDPVVEVIKDAEQHEDHIQMPLLVYVSREKRPSYPHHFKAGALNVLLRVSGIMSNSPYILTLDCDMYCNDPKSARQAMCFHLDPDISPSLAFVQFPQKFHNLSANDIYDSEIRSTFRICWQGMDGLKGPSLSGTNFYIKRNALYGINKYEDRDLEELKNYFGHSNEFIKSLQPDKEHGKTMDFSLLQETKLLASCAYESDTKWGSKVGFMYDSVLEDFFTGFLLTCKGWSSVYLNPSRPQFLGSSTTNLNDLLIQVTRWSSGLVGVAISKFCPLIYCPPRKLSFLQTMCFAQLALFPLLYGLSLSCLATIPQLCLLSGIPLYPEVSNSFFFIFIFIFTSSLAQHLYEVLFTNGSIREVINEERIWMIKSVTCYIYGSLDAIMKVLGLREASFVPTNKVEDNDQVKRYRMGIFDFQTSTRLLAPLTTIVILNMVSFFVGIIRMINAGGKHFDKLIVQVFLSFYILTMNYPVIEGMFIRTDKGMVPPSVTLLSSVFAVILCALGYLILIY